MAIEDDTARAGHDPVLDTFDAIYELAARLGQVMAQGLEERGLSSARAEVLFRLHGHGPMVQRELSSALRCTPRHVTGLVDQLETTGLVVRKPHPTDRRATLVALTAKGSRLANRMNRERERSAQQMLGDLPVDELRTTYRVLRGFLDRLEPATDDGTDRSSD